MKASKISRTKVRRSRIDVSQFKLESAEAACSRVRMLATWGGRFMVMWLPGVTMVSSRRKNGCQMCSRPTGFTPSASLVFEQQAIDRQRARR